MWSGLRSGYFLFWVVAFVESRGFRVGERLRAWTSLAVVGWWVAGDKRDGRPDGNFGHSHLRALCAFAKKVSA